MEPINRELRGTTILRYIFSEIKFPDPSTLHGCDCNSYCHTNFIDGLKYDYCKVDQECDTFSFLQNGDQYDKCEYKTENWISYENLDYATKENWLLDQILANAGNTKHMERKAKNRAYTRGAKIFS